MVQEQFSAIQICRQAEDNGYQSDLRAEVSTTTSLNIQRPVDIYNFSIFPYFSNSILN